MKGEKTLNDIKEGYSVVKRILNDKKTIESLAKKTKRYSRIYTIGAGSSFWMSEITASLLRSYKVDATAIHSSNFLFSNYPLKNTLIIAFSQSGETTETKKAIQKAKKSNCQIFSIIGQPNSSIAKLSHLNYITNTGKECPMATKSIDAAILTSYIYIHALLNKKTNLSNLPLTMKKSMKVNISKVTTFLKKYQRAYSLGIDIDYGIAGELSTKFAESPLIQVTPLHALEISHGPKSNVKNIPTFIITTEKKYRKHYISLIKELIKTKAKIIVISNQHYPSDFFIKIPSNSLTIFSTIKVIQRIAQETAVKKNLNPDSPQNLPKFIVRKDL